MSAVGSLLRRVPPRELIELDRLARDDPWYAENSFKKWQRLRVGDLAALERIRDGRAAVAVATFHPSGYVREAAIHRLASTPAEPLLPFLLLRLNDWVEPVRQAARSALERYLPSVHPDVLLEHLPLLLRVRTGRRGDYEPFVAAIARRLQQPDAWPTLVRGLDTPDPQVRWECFQLALTAGSRDGEGVIERAVDDSEPAIRLLGVLHSHSQGDEALRRLLETAARDRDAAVRRAALEAYAARLAGEAEQPLKEALLDSNSSVRELARLLLRRRDGRFDAATFYRETLPGKAGRQLIAAILGLAEAGGSADTHILRTFCTHPQAKVRHAALRALVRLDVRAQAEPIMDALTDPSPRVSNWARRILAERTGLIDPEAAQEYALSDIWPRHTRLNTLRLLSHLSQWIALPIFLRAAADPDPEVADAAQVAARACLGRTFLTPNSRQLHEIEEAITAAGNRLHPAVRDVLEQTMRFWRGEKA